jgi:hypothetical protein
MESLETPLPLRNIVTELTALLLVEAVVRLEAR